MRLLFIGNTDQCEKAQNLAEEHGFFCHTINIDRSIYNFHNSIEFWTQALAEGIDHVIIILDQKIFKGIFAPDWFDDQINQFSANLLTVILNESLKKVMIVYDSSIVKGKYPAIDGISYAIHNTTLDDRYIRFFSDINTFDIKSVILSWLP